MKKETIQTVIIVIACLMFCFAGKAQSKWYKLSGKDIAGYSLMAFSGVSYGYNQAILHHHYGQGNRFWDKTISWQNKYKQWPTDKSAAYFGSKSFLAFTTDGQHLTQFLSTSFVIGGTSLLVWDMKGELKGMNKRDKWKYVLIRKILLPLIIRSVAFEYTFNHL